MITDLINFELWSLKNEDYSDEKLLKASYHLVMNDIKESIEKYNTTCIVGLLIFDGFLYKNTDEFYAWLAKVEKSSKKLGIQKLFLMPGQAHNYQHEIDKRNLDFEILEFHWPVQECMNNCAITDSVSWNSNTEKFLFLGGVPSRINRIGTLARLYESGMLHKHGVWSFFPPASDYDKEWCRNYLSEYTDEEYNQFLINCKNDLDKKYSEVSNYSSLSGVELEEYKIFESDLAKNPYLIDKSYFTNTSISILSECWYIEKNITNKFVTEKIWKAVINDHPFILTDHPDRILYLKELGLKTFEEYFPIPTYGTMSFDDQTTALITNLEYFLKNAYKHEDKIIKDIAHNKQVFLNLYNNNQKILNRLKSDYGLLDSSYNKYIVDGKLSVYYRVPDYSDIPKHCE